MSENEEKIEVKEFSNNSCCECCKCKKIFMLAVILILVFIAGIMVGNCRPCYYPNNYYSTQKSHNKIKKHKLHRGMHPTQIQSITSPTHQPINPPTNSNPQIGGFIIEVD